MIDRERLDKTCARGVLALVLAILVFSALATGAVRTQDFLVIQWLVVVLIAVWGVRFVVNPKHRLLWAPVCWAILLFVAYAIVRYLQADVELVARRELIRILVYAVLFYAIVTNLHKQDTSQVVALTLIVLAAAIAMYAIAQFLTESDRVWHFLRPAIYTKRGSGTFISPNHLAGYLEMILPLGLAYTLTGRFEHVQKVVIGYCSLVIFAGIAVTVSRGGWMATVLMLMVLFFWLTRQRGYRLQALLLFLAMIAIAGVFFLKANFSQNRKEILANTMQMEDLRYRLWEPAFQMWQDHFWWGVGPGHFDCRFGEYRPAHDQFQTRPVRVHNDYLNTLVDWGLVGGLLVLAIWALFYWEVFRSWKYIQRAPNDLTTKRSNKTSLVMGASLGLLAILLHSFVDFKMHVPAIAIVAVTLLALVTGHFRFATERYWVTLHWPLRSLVLLVLLAALAYLGTEAWRGTREFYWLNRAEGAPNPAATARALERAFAVEPQNFETPYRLGEIYRNQSFHGRAGYAGLAETALKWYQHAIDANPFHSFSWLFYGVSLDWLGRRQEAETYVERARMLNPNYYYILAWVGWHYFQVANVATNAEEQRLEYEKARRYFDQSLAMKYSTNNTIARAYYTITRQRLAELDSPKTQK